MCSKTHLGYTRLLRRHSRFVGSKTVVLIPIFLAIAVAISCGTSGRPAPWPAAGTTQVDTATSRLSASTASTRRAPDAATITSELQAAGLPIPHGVNVYTAATDPNSLLGRPGEYTSKTEWEDLRYPLGDEAADCGVEVFPNGSLAKKRAAYIQSLMGGLLGAEYDYLAGPVLLRIGGKLTPPQADQYAAVIGAKLYQQ